MKKIEMVMVEKEKLEDNFYTEWGTLDVYEMAEHEITDLNGMLKDYLLDNWWDNDANIIDVELTRDERISADVAEVEFIVTSYLDYCEVEDLKHSGIEIAEDAQKQVTYVARIVVKDVEEV